MTHDPLTIALQIWCWSVTFVDVQIVPEDSGAEVADGHLLPLPQLTEAAVANSSAGVKAAEEAAVANAKEEEAAVAKATEEAASVVKAAEEAVMTAEKAAVAKAT